MQMKQNSHVDENKFTGRKIYSLYQKLKKSTFVLSQEVKGNEI